MGDGDGEHGTAASASLREGRRRRGRAARALHRARRASPAIEAIGQDAFLEILLQRRFLSLMFPVMYDVGIDGLTDADRDQGRARDPARGVSGPVGRDALAPRGPRRRPRRARRHARAGPRVAPDAPSRQAVIEAQLRAHRRGDRARHGPRAHDDHPLLGRGARVGRVRRVLAAHGGAVRRRRTPPRASITPITTTTAATRWPPPPTTSATHSGRLGACLVRLLDGDGGEERFAATEARVLALRLDFYDQF